MLRLPTPACRPSLPRCALTPLAPGPALIAGAGVRGAGHERQAILQAVSRAQSPTCRAMHEAADPHVPSRLHAEPAVSAPWTPKTLSVHRLPPHARAPCLQIMPLAPNTHPPRVTPQLQDLRGAQHGAAGGAARHLASILPAARPLPPAGGLHRPAAQLRCQPDTPPQAPGRRAKASRCGHACGGSGQGTCRPCPEGLSRRRAQHQQLHRQPGRQHECRGRRRDGQQRRQRQQRPDSKRPAPARRAAVSRAVPAPRQQPRQPLQ